MSVSCCHECDTSYANTLFCKGGCYETCSGCCTYGGDHPPYECPLGADKCKLCIDGCEGCVVYNHTPNKTTYGGEHIHPCRHVNGKLTRVNVLEEDVAKRAKLYEAAKDSYESAKKKLKQEREGL